MDTQNHHSWKDISLPKPSFLWIHVKLQGCILFPRHLRFTMSDLFFTAKSVNSKTLFDGKIMPGWRGMSRKQHYRNNHGYIVSPKSRVVGSLPNGRTPWLINNGEPKHLLLVPGIWGWFPSWWTEGLTSGAKTWMVCPVPGTCISGKNRGLRSREPYRSHPTTTTFFKIRWYQHTKMLFFFPGLGIGPKKWRGKHEKLAGYFVCRSYRIGNIW